MVAYRRRDFHPNQQASNLSAQWLEHNRHRFTPWVKPAEPGGSRRSAAPALQGIFAIDFIATRA